MVYTLLFSVSKCSLFHNYNVFSSCIIHIFYTGCAKIKKKIIPAPKVNYNQQVAAILDYLFLKGSTCFGLFLRPSSGAHNCTFSFRYCQPVLLQAGIVGWRYLLTVPEIECAAMCS